MLAIARGLIARPAVLMLDEPSLGLAPMLVEGLYDLLAELRDEGTTILLVDQMAALALSVADRAYVLQSGTIRQSRPRRRAPRRPRHRAGLPRRNRTPSARGPPLPARGERVGVRGGPARDAPPPRGGGLCVRGFSSAIADRATYSTAELNRWTHRVGVSCSRWGAACTFRHPSTPASPRNLTIGNRRLRARSRSKYEASG